ncbi:MAG: RluA family pseudouridine synthase [bacterium]
MSGEDVRVVVLTADEDAGRVDAFLAERLSGFSRSRVQKLIRGGRVELEGASCEPDARVRAGDTVVVLIPPPESSDVRPEAIPLDVVYEDEHLIVVNKPAGMTVHPVPHRVTGTLVNALLHHCGSLSGIGGVSRPGIVHRLDKETSGLIVAAKNDAAHESLSRQIAERTVRKRYIAVVHGVVKKDAGRVQTLIGRSRTNRKKMAVVRSGGREAETGFEVVERFRFFTRLEVVPVTGRTHQIRVHMAHIGHPIAGDAAYGGGGFRAGAAPRRAGEDVRSALGALRGHALHAWRLEFMHPATGRGMSFEAPLREDVSRFIEVLRGGRTERAVSGGG